MSDISSLKTQVQTEADKILPELIKIKNKIGNNPELGSEEEKSSRLLVELLRKNGFEVEYPFSDMHTAFKGVIKGKTSGPIIAILAEYDALPGVGHGCGHNIIGTSGVGAGIALKKIIDELQGEVWVIGTPAEEGHGPYAGAKIQMALKGVFDEVDVSYMVHPTGNLTTVMGNFLAVSGVRLEFKGKTAHAAADAHNGQNALNAAMVTYMAIHANRQQLRRDANAVVHGIITEGGLASNIIPDRAVLSFGVRSSDDTYVPELVDMVVNSAKGAALATGCTVEITTRTGLKSNLQNKGLEKLFQNIFDELCHPYKPLEEAAVIPPGGSTDFSDITHIVPGIHPLIGLGVENIAGHSTALAEATLTPKGDKALEIGVKTMAMATVELLKKPELLREIQKEFEAKRLD
jgi:amidohydrolase